MAPDKKHDKGERHAQLTPTHPQPPNATPVNGHKVKLIKLSDIPAGITSTPPTATTPSTSKKVLFTTYDRYGILAHGYFFLDAAGQTELNTLVSAYANSTPVSYTLGTSYISHYVADEGYSDTSHPPPLASAPALCQHFMLNGAITFATGPMFPPEM